jgi:uncharacterized protein YdaU (DUF1376 family)
MAKAPIMPVFTDALIGDTTHLSTEQFGAYVLILLATWRNNGRALPDDDERMAHVCRAGVKRWRSKLRPAVSEFFDISDGSWRQHRLEKEWERVTNLIAKRRASAAAGGRATAARNAATDGARKDNLEDSEKLFDRPESLNAARAKEKKSSDVNPEEGRCAPLGRNLTVECEPDRPKMRMPVASGPALALPSQAPATDYRAVLPPDQALRRTQTPVGAVPAGATHGGTDDVAASLPSPVADPNRLGPRDQARTDPLAGSASGPSTRFGALRGGGEPCPRKSPALKAKIRDQLVSKCARFLVDRRRPAEVAAYWAAMLSDDAGEAQRMLDATDRRMRQANWDDMRQWKTQHPDIAA